MPWKTQKLKEKKERRAIKLAHKKAASVIGRQAKGKDIRKYMLEQKRKEDEHREQSMREAERMLSELIAGHAARLAEKQKLEAAKRKEAAKKQHQVLEADDEVAMPVLAKDLDMLEQVASI